MKPKLLYSEVTDKLYIVTDYKELGNGNYEARRKYDVTEDFDLIALKREQRDKD